MAPPNSYLHQAFLAMRSNIGMYFYHTTLPRLHRSILMSAASRMITALLMLIGFAACRTQHETRVGDDAPPLLARMWSDGADRFAFSPNCVGCVTRPSAYEQEFALAIFAGEFWYRTPDKEAGMDGWRRSNESDAVTLAQLVDLEMTKWNTQFPVGIANAYAYDLLNVYLRKEESLETIAEVLGCKRSTPNNMWRLSVVGNDNGDLAAIQLWPLAWAGDDVKFDASSSIAFSSADITVDDFVTTILASKAPALHNSNTRQVPITIDRLQLFAIY